jgi:DNA-binding response OmpR family regulator
MQPYKILIVDDEDSFREILSNYLALHGYKLFGASSGIKCMEMLDDVRPDLILLDIRMPEMDGFETMKAIKKIPEFSNVPVLFISNLQKPLIKYKGLELGADDFITKPFDNTELIARIRLALRRGKKYKQMIGAMEGNLGDVPLGDLLQTMILGTKTALIQFEELDAEILIKEGEIVHSRIDFFSGKDAIMRIFIIGGGRFSVDFDFSVEDYGEEDSLKGYAVMSVMVLIDEVNSILKAFPEENPLITINTKATDYPSIRKFHNLSPLHLKKLLILMKGEKIKENANLLVEAYNNGKLELGGY